MTTTFKPYPKYKPSGVEWLGDIPEHWEIAPLFSIGQERKQKNKGMLEDNLLSLSYGRIVRKDIDSTDGLLPESFETYQIVKKGDIVFRLTDLQNDKRSLRSALVKEDGIITSAYLAIQPSGANSIFLNCLYRSYDTCKVFYSMGGGLRQSMKYDEMKRLPTLLPSSEEQTAIANFLDSETAKIDETLKELEASVELLNEEKTSLINEYVTGKINPETGKPYPKYKPSGVEWLGDIPEHWTVEKITNGFRQIGSGTTPKSEMRDYYEGDIPWVTTSELRETVITATASSLTEEALKDYSSLKKYESGSLLIAMYGGTIGRLGILGIEATCNQACCVFAEPKRLTVKYCYYWLWSQRPVLIAMASGGGQPNLSQTSLKQLRLPFPPLSEQTAISSFLDSESSKVESLISEKQSLIESLKEYRTSLIHEAVTGKIDLRNA